MLGGVKLFVVPLPRIAPRCNNSRTAHVLPLAFGAKGLFRRSVFITDLALNSQGIVANFAHKYQIYAGGVSASPNQGRKSPIVLRA